jgi:arginine decarboxylase
MEAQRNAAAAAVGSAYPVFELPSDASALNGDSALQVVAEDT